MANIEEQRTLIFNVAIAVEEAAVMVILWAYTFFVAFTFCKVFKIFTTNLAEFWNKKPYTNNCLVRNFDFSTKKYKYVYIN